MTNDEIEAAIRYNRKAGFSRDEVQTIQRVTGSKPDGVWGPDTIRGISNWQTCAGVKPDGMVGPTTWAEISLELEDELPATPGNPQVETGVGCGLAAYDIVFPGHTAAESLQAALDGALAEGVEEIRYWSSEWLIDDIGNKGEPYGEPFLRSLNLASDIRLGAWIDDPISAIVKPAYATRLARMGVNAAALMINRSNTRESDPPWVLRWKDEDKLKRVADNFEAKGIERICTTWPRPSKSMIDRMCEDLVRILRLVGSVAFEVDAEGNWLPKHLQGFSNMRTAAVYLADSMRAAIIAAGVRARTELTTYTYHTENSKKAVLACLLDFLLPQAYAVRHRGSGRVEWNGSLGPVKHSKFAIKRARQAAAA